MQRFVIVGLGHFGSWIAQSLYQQRNEVIGIDRRADVIDRHVDLVSRGVVGDATDRQLLNDLGLGPADTAIVSTGDDLAAAVLVTQALKDMKIREVYVKVASRDAARVFESLGVADTIFPDRESALRLAHRLSAKGVFDYLPLAKGYSMQEVAIPDAWIGRSLRDLQLPQTYGINVVALYDVLTDQLHPVPDPDAPLTDSHLAVVIGRDETIADVLGTPSRH